MALYDCCLDDGVTQHQDFHNGFGELHPEWWGQLYHRHFPNHGFVGDIFTVNGTAFPVLNVYRRKYRFRFLGASVSRIYELMLMRGTPTAAPGTQGQYQIPDAQQCHQFTQIASEGGLLPGSRLRAIPSRSGRQNGEKSSLISLNSWMALRLRQVMCSTW